MSCRLLFMQLSPVAFILLRVKAGSSKPARIAMMAITTKSSMSVNAPTHSRLRSAEEDFDGKKFVFKTNGCLK